MSSAGGRVAFGAGLLVLAVGCGSTSGGGGPASGTAGQGATSGTGNGGAAGVTGGTSGVAASGAAGASGAGAGMAGGSGGGTSDAAAACSAYANAYCSLVLGCQVTAFEDLFGTMSNCTGAFVATCMDRFGAPGAQTTPAMVAACAAALVPANGCRTYRAACEFQGTSADGTACAYDAQCQSKLCILPDYGAACGVCGAPAPKGAVCNQSNGCVTGLQCGRAVCVSSLPQGSACDQSQFECAFPNVCVSGTCQPPPGLNQPCDALYSGCSETDDAECLHGVCQKLVWNSVGGDCDASNGILCLGGLACNPVGGPGRCEARAPGAPQLAADCH